MEKGEYKKVLSEIFDVLGFSEFEKEKATESFKKKLISDLFQSLKDKLPEDQQEWIKGQDKNTNPQDSHIPQIQETIRNMYSEEELHNRSREVFRLILKDYVNSMSKKIEHEKAKQLDQIVESF